MEGEVTGSRSGAPTLVVTVVAVAVAFLVAVAPWSSDDFGYSLDGFNGSMWGLGARAAADDPVGSRLGGVHADGQRYANHPPLTVWAAATGSAVSGDRPGAVRAPALIASVLALAVLALLLRDAGLRGEAAAAGVALAGTAGMFLTYGAMLDTPVVSLPFGLAALAAAQRVWQGRPPRPWVLGLLGALAVLSGWQGALAAALGAGVCLLAPAPAGATSPTRRGALALGAGVALGTAMTVAWIAWVYRSLRPVLDQAGERTGDVSRGSDAGWTTALGRHLTDLYGPTPVLLVLAVAVVVAVAVPLGRGPSSGDDVAAGSEPSPSWWRPSGLRPVAAVLVVTVVGYTLLFRNGAAIHDYWTYWGVALVGLGTAAVVQLVLTRTPLRRLSAVPAALLVAVVVIPLAVVGTARQTTAETRIREGLDLLPILGQVPEASDPDTVAVAVYGAPGELPWAEHLLHGRAVEVDDPAAVGRLPADLPVLVILRGPASERLQAIATARNERFVLLPAGDLARHLAG